MKTPKFILWTTTILIIVCACFPSVIEPIFKQVGSSESIPQQTVPFLHLLLIAVPSTILGAIIGYVVAKPLLKRLFNKDKSIIINSLLIALITFIACILAYNSSFYLVELGHFIREYFFIYETYEMDTARQIIGGGLFAFIALIAYNIILFAVVSLVNGILSYLYLARNK